MTLRAKLLATTATRCPTLLPRLPLWHTCALLLEREMMTSECFHSPTPPSTLPTQHSRTALCSTPSAVWVCAYFLLRAADLERYCLPPAGSRAHNATVVASAPWQRAMQLYLRASAVQPCSGRPHNKLAALAMHLPTEESAFERVRVCAVSNCCRCLTKPHTHEQVYRYARALLVPSPSDIAAKNLVHVLDDNERLVVSQRDTPDTKVRDSDPPIPLPRSLDIHHLPLLLLFLLQRLMSAGPKALMLPAPRKTADNPAPRSVRAQLYGWLLTRCVSVVRGLHRGAFGKLGESKPTAGAASRSSMTGLGMAAAAEEASVVQGVKLFRKTVQIISRDLARLLKVWWGA